MKMSTCARSTQWFHLLSVKTKNLSSSTFSSASGQFTRKAVFTRLIRRWSTSKRKCTKVSWPGWARPWWAKSFRTFPFQLSLWRMSLCSNPLVEMSVTRRYCLKNCKIHHRLKKWGRPWFLWFPWVQLVLVTPNLSIQSWARLSKLTSTTVHFTWSRLRITLRFQVFISKGVDTKFTEVSTLRFLFE